MGNKLGTCWEPYENKRKYPKKPPNLLVWVGLGWVGLGFSHHFWPRLMAMAGAEFWGHGWITQSSSTWDHV
jgi:hypothetical protein